MNFCRLRSFELECLAYRIEAYEFSTPAHLWLIVFIHSSGVAQADVRSLHTHHFLQRVPWKPQGAGQTHQWRRAVPHRTPQPCKPWTTFAAALAIGKESD